MSSYNIKDDLNPGVLSLLPLFYVGWSDSVLSPSEIEVLHKSLDKFKFLNSEDKTYLIKYTDPKNPPSAEVFKYWLKSIQKYSKNIPINQKRNLIDLGIEIAKSKSLNHSDTIWSDPETRNALVEIQNALGIYNQQSENLILNKIESESDNSYSKQSDFPIEAMKSLLDEPYSELRKKMKIILKDPLFELSFIPDKEEYRLLTLKRLKALANQGVSSFSFPKTYGGEEKKGDHIVVFEMLAYSDLSLTIKFGVQFGLFGGALFQLGTEYHHRKYLKAMHKAELLGCFAMTETGHGSNVKGLCTTATYNKAKDQIIIHSPDMASGKEYIGNALHSEMAAVFAQLIVDDINHGVHAVLVPLRDKEGILLPGIKIEDCGYKIGLNGVDNGRIWFDQVHVPRENLLNKYGSITPEGTYESDIENPSKRFFTMLGALVVGRISVGLASINATKKALSIAVKYALKRKQFAPKNGMEESLIMDYPTHQLRLIPAISKSYVYYFALRDLAEQYVRNNDGSETRKIETLAAGLKAKASWFATSTIQTCREACGGKAYLIENQIGSLKADTDIFTTFEGDNTVLMQLVAKGLLTEFKQSFHDDGIKAVISFLLKKAKHKMDEYNPLSNRNTDYSHLTSFSFFSDCFNYRYNKTLISLSERMKKYLDKRIDPYQAFLKTQLHMTDLADAYIDKICLDVALQKVKSENDLQLKEVLKMIVEIYAVQTIYENRGWYMETDYMEGSKVKALRRVRNKLIQSARPHVGALVDSYGIPEELIFAPIALKDIS